MEGQEIRKINMFGDMMKLYFFFLRSGGSFLSIWGFLRSMFRFENVFGVAKVRICFGYA